VTVSLLVTPERLQLVDGEPMGTSRNSNLSTKLTVLTAAAFVAISVVSTVGFVTAGRLAGENADSQRFAIALRASATADMNHDALHADVLQSLLSKPGSEDGRAAHESAVEHGEGLKGELTENPDILLTPQIKESVSALESDVNAYAQAGEQITRTALTDNKAAMEQLPAFLTQFEKLVVALEANSEVIELAGEAQNSQAESLARTARIVIASVALISLVGFATVARWMGRSAMQKVAAEQFRVATSAEQLVNVNKSVGENVATVRRESEAMVTGANQVNTNVAALAAAVEEMSASIAEIARSAGEAAVVAGHAVGTVDHTTTVVAQLGDSSSEIGKVLDVITSIAEQTNLLALNATIEAARAGEAGKGFAVVANEVKELAKETAKATEEIAHRVGAIQGDTGLAVTAIAEISGVIQQINDFQNAIASAVEEQTATTNEIAGNLGDVSRLTQESLHNIESVSASADDAAVSIVEGERIAASLGATGSTKMPPARTPLPRRTLPGASDSGERPALEVLSHY
jgi:hypothetical protein